MRELLHFCTILCQKGMGANTATRGEAQPGRYHGNEVIALVARMKLLPDMAAPGIEPGSRG